MSHKHSRAVWVLALVLSQAVVTRSARADDTAAADTVFEEGRQLREAGNFAAACPKFEAAYELSKTLGTLLSIADCREKNGNLATALEQWNKAIAIAKDKSDERLGYAEQRKGALEPRVPSLTLDVKQGAEKLAVRVNGKPVEESSWGLSFHLDPGPVSIEVMRGEAVLDKQSIDIKESESKRVPVDLAAIAKAHPLPKKRVEPANPAQRYAGITVLSVGLAGIVTFGILEGAALGQRGEADQPGGCVDKEDGTTICSPNGFDLAQRAGDLAEAGQWIGVGGLAVVAVGLTVFLTAPKDAPADEPGKKKKTSELVVLPWASPEGGGLVVGGRL